jgi:hypothetical protein
VVGVFQVCIFYACLHVHVHFRTCSSELPWLYFLVILRAGDGIAEMIR